ncbi:MAG TPA: hypothetical protein VF841_05380 [Anaeromyxobacter sp.]
MRERNGVRLGQRVRDADEKDLGRVTRLHEWGFEVGRTFLVRFGRGAVVRYDEVRGVRDGALVVARSDRDLLELAAGGVPRSWRVPAPPGYPSAATPAEAQLVLEDIARGAVFSRAAGDEPLVFAPPEAPPITREEELEYALTRGQAAVGAARAAEGASAAAAERARSRSSGSASADGASPRPGS